MKSTTIQNLAKWSFQETHSSSVDRRFVLNLTNHERWVRIVMPSNRRDSNRGDCYRYRVWYEKCSHWKWEEHHNSQCSFKDPRLCPAKLCQVNQRRRPCPACEDRTSDQGCGCIVIWEAVSDANWYQRVEYNHLLITISLSIYHSIAIPSVAA